MTRKDHLRRLLLRLQKSRGVNPGLKTLLMCALCTTALAPAAKADCWARDALHNGMVAAPVGDAITSAAATPAWKTISLGTIAGKSALRSTLETAGCGTSAAAEDMLAQSRFALSTGYSEVDLVAVSAADLGLRTGSLSLASVYARAHALGFQLAAAEIGPQLRLQYFAQPAGEFLNIAMAPIELPQGAPGIFVVANGGAGLLLLTHNAEGAEFFPTSRFVFVRASAIATTQRK